MATSWMLFSALVVCFAVCSGQSPSPVTNLRAISIEERSLQVAWTLPGDTLDAVLLEFNATSPFITRPVRLSLSGNTEEYTLVNLQEGVTYRITVYVEDGGLVSNPVSGQYTTVEIDPGAPRELRVIGTTDTSITIGFKTPAIMQWNVEALSNFRVCWTEYDESNHDDPCDASSSVSVNNANNEDFEYTYTARGLAPGARYFFSVGVISNRGRSSLATSELLVSTVGVTGLIQLRLGKINNCYDWISENPNSLNDVTEMVYLGIRSNCACNFVRNGGAIRYARFSCRLATDGLVYRAAITVPKGSDFNTVIAALDQWKSNTYSLEISGQEVDLIQSCPTVLASFQDKDCVIDHSGAVAGGVVGSLILLVVIAVAVIFLVGILWYKGYCPKRGQKKTRQYDIPRHAPEVGQGFHNPVTASYEVPIAEAQDDENTGHNRYEVDDSFESSAAASKEPHAQ